MITSRARGKHASVTAIQATGGDDLACDTYNQANPPPTSCGPFLDVDTRITALVLLDASTQSMRYHELARVGTASILIGQDYVSRQRGIERSDVDPNYRVDVLDSIHVPSFTNACQRTSRGTWLSFEDTHEHRHEDDGDRDDD